MTKYICWFSCGVTSTIACYLTLQSLKKGDEADIVYIETGQAHPDNQRIKGAK